MAADRPNIVFVHVDQMHAEAVSAYGNPYVRTPNIDRMVADGTSFMRNYTTMPQCCPARASWYTGRMSTEHGVVVNSCPIDPEIPDLGQWLRRQANYETLYTGKWHVSGRPLDQSFDVLLGAGQGEVNDTAVARTAVGFLQNRKPSDQPFFLNVGFMNPHDCCYTAGAEGGIGKFACAEEIEGLLPDLPANFVRSDKHGARTAGWRDLEWRFYRYIYFRMVEMVDAEIGRVYDALKRSPHWENTLLIFSCDHGDGLGFHGNISKGYLEEEAWRVPCIVIAPEGVPAGVMDTEHLTTGVDIPATICDYADVPDLPKMTVGRSWRPIFEGQQHEWRRYVVGETNLGGSSVSVRDARYKTIFHNTLPSRTYDLENDALEMTNLAGTTQGERIQSRHRRFAREYRDSIELCAEPTWGNITPVERARYRGYLEWYQEDFVG